MSYVVVIVVPKLARRLKNNLAPLGLAKQARDDIASLQRDPYVGAVVRGSRFSRRLRYGPWRLLFAVFEADGLVEVWRFRRKKPHGYARIPKEY